MSEKQQDTPPDLEEVVRAQIDAVNRRDIDALMSLAASDAVYDTSPSGLGVYTFEAARTLIQDYWGAFEELHFELEELLDLGNGVVFTVQRQRARPAGSDAWVTAREAHVTEWVAARVRRVTVYIDVDAGREAAKQLSEERR